MEHVLIRRLEDLTRAETGAPALSYGVEVRDRPGPLHKHGAFEDDGVWMQVRGGLFVARATVRICWVGEYSTIREVRDRTGGSPLHGVEGFWAHRPKFGYAAVATLQREHWIEPFWAGPRSYGYEWVLLENEPKRRSWLEPKPSPRGGGGLLDDVRTWLAG